MKDATEEAPAGAPVAGLGWLSGSGEVGSPVGNHASIPTADPLLRGFPPCSAFAGAMDERVLLELNPG